jgi:N-sulfoglucosamine sulfohydrolase
MFMIKSFSLPGCCLLVLLLITASHRGKGQSAPVRPNVLVIVADDWSLHAGVYGDKVVPTPAIDGLAREGVVFEQAFCAAPSCSPSRAAMLTGRYPHQLQQGANLWGTLPASYPNYTRLLAESGYTIGLEGKGWGPGDHQAGGYTHNPAGPAFKSFAVFMEELPGQTPFCFWIGSTDPHRPYDPELKKSYNLNEQHLKVPAWLPDNEQVREDLLDYYAEVARFDQTVQGAVNLLKEKKLLENTLIIVTGDNGMPFPRAKANVYDSGSKVPLIICWGNRLRKGSRYRELVNLIDIAPTVLQAAGLPAPNAMTGESLLPLLTGGKTSGHFDQVFLERERHANVRKDNLGYPVRAVRTQKFLYVLNLEPGRWPAGDPDVFVLPGPFGDIDNGKAKEFLLANRDNPEMKQWVVPSLEKRPAEELYDLEKDPDQLKNVAAAPAYAKVKEQLKQQLQQWRRQTKDPSLNGQGHLFDEYTYYGGQKKK